MFEAQLYMIRIHKWIVFSHVYFDLFYQMVLYFYVICILNDVLCWNIETMFMNCVVYGRTSCKTAPGWWVILVKYDVMILMITMIMIMIIMMITMITIMVLIMLTITIMMMMTMMIIIIMITTIITIAITITIIIKSCEIDKVVSEMTVWRPISFKTVDLNILATEPHEMKHVCRTWISNYIQQNIEIIYPCPVAPFTNMV